MGNQGHCGKQLNNINSKKKMTFEELTSEKTFQIEVYGKECQSVFFGAGKHFKMLNV